MTLSNQREIDRKKRITKALDEIAKKTLSKEKKKIDALMLSTHHLKILKYLVKQVVLVLIEKI